MRTRRGINARVLFGPLVGLFVLLPACNAPQAETQPRAQPASRPPPENTPAPSPSPPTPPPPIDGALLTAGDTLYVQLCTDQAPCASMRFPEARDACAKLQLGGVDGWRLPTRRELESLPAKGEISGPRGYHWTGTPYDQDSNQAWIVGLDGRRSTTIPHDRKPFIVRCVRPAAPKK